MADIFISYASQDRERAGEVAALLELAGWSIWWDRRIPAGRTWRKVIEQAVIDARCMLVLWSHHSVASTWVAEEAEEARRLRKDLFPVLIDAVEPPIGFRTIQSADLSRWDGSADHPAARALVNDLKSLLGSPRDAIHGTEQTVIPPETAWDRFLRGLRAHWPKAALGFGALVILLLAMQLGWKASPPSVEKIATPEPAPAPALTRLAVTGQRNRIKPAEKVRLTARGEYSDGSQSDLRSGVEWMSSDTAVAVVDEQGEVTGLKAGSATIVAKIGAVESAEWTVGVEPAESPVKAAPEPKIVALQIASSKKELLTAERIALRARALYSDKSEKSLSSGVEWQVSDRALASVNGRGELTARRPGKVEVVARADRISSPPETFWIKDKPAETLPYPRPDPVPAKKAAPEPQLQGLSEQALARITAHIRRAQSYREQGNYSAAMAELAKAQTIDTQNDEIRREIEQTKRACNAERTLGNSVSC